MNDNILGLDIGEKRIGVARVNIVARLPEALGVLKNDTALIDNLKKIVQQHQISELIVGLPRNMNGQETRQTTYVRDFCKRLLQPLGLPIYLQDETLSSRQAEARLKTREYQKGDIDAQAAVIILEDYLKTV